MCSEQIDARFMLPAHIDKEQTFGKFWASVRRKQAARKRCKIFNCIINN